MSKPQSELNNEKEANLNHSEVNQEAGLATNNAITSNIQILQVDNQQIPINLEDLLIQEDKLWKILDNIRTNCNFNFAAEEYLEFAQITSVQDLSIFFSIPKTKTSITHSSIYEYVAVMLGSFVYLKSLLTPSSVDHLKNILYYCHQNLLLIISMILKKVAKSYQNNVWVLKLRQIIQKKKSSFVEGDDLVILDQNNGILRNSLNTFFLLYFNNANEARIFAILNDILFNISKCTIDNVKNNLQNLKNMLIHCGETTHNGLGHVNLPGPFLPKIDAKKYKYTLVLDLDETLIHCPEQQEIHPLIRPGTQEFLSELSKYYEIVIFTAAVQDYADEILDMIDKNKEWITHRLYRQHTTVLKRSYCKDIGKLGRDLTRTIIIDNASDNFQLQIDNGIFINTWIDDESDTALYDLIPILREIVVKKIKDVRKALRKIRDTMIRFYVKGDTNPYSTVLAFVKGEKRLPE